MLIPKVSKFIVLKREECDKYLSYDERVTLYQLILRITKARHFEGKIPMNDYLVVNTDEPYAEDVAEIMRKHGIEI
jgi:hypothetical protein